MQKRLSSALCLSQLLLLCSMSIPAYSASTQVAAGSKSDYLLPPLAPKFDFSANKKGGSGKGGSNSSGSSSSNSSSGDDASAYQNDDASNPMNDASKQALQKATMLYQQGRIDDAEAAFRHVLTLNVRSVDAYYNLGVIAETKGDFQSALNNYQVASRLNPDDAELHDAVNAVQGKIAQKSASDERNRSQQRQAQELAKSQQSTDSLKQMAADAQAAYKAGNYDRAINNLSAVASQAPNDPDVQYALAMAYKGKGDQQSARSALNRALSIDPNNRLYLTAMSQLNNSRSGIGSAGSAPLPGGGAGSRSYADDTANAGSGGSLPHTPYNAPFSSSGGQQTGWQSAGADNLASTGQITPFTSQGESSLPGGGVHRGGVAGSGASGFLLGTGGPGGTKTRLTRAAVGAGAGLAVGAMFGAGSHRGMGRSMMSGAMIGGALGLFSGGW